MNVSFPIQNAEILEVSLFEAKIQAGFPSPADDHMALKLDLNRYLIDNPNTTFFVRVTNDAMIKLGIRQNNLLLVDRSLRATNNKIVVAVVEGEFLVRKLKISGKNVYLISENKHFSPIKLENDFTIWGVVTSVIHQF